MLKQNDINIEETDETINIYIKKVDCESNRVALNKNLKTKLENIKFLHAATLEFLIYLIYGVDYFNYHIPPRKYFNGIQYLLRNQYNNILTIRDIISIENINDIVSDLKMLNLQDSIYVYCRFPSEQDKNYYIELDLARIFDMSNIAFYDHRYFDLLTKKQPETEQVSFVFDKKNHEIKILKDEILNFEFIEIDYSTIHKKLLEYLNLFEKNLLIPDSENYFSYSQLRKMSKDILGEIYESASQKKLLNKRIFQNIDNIKNKINKIRFFEFILLLMQHNYISIDDVNINNGDVTLEVYFNNSPDGIAKNCSSVVRYKDFRVNKDTGEVCYKGNIFKLKPTNNPFMFLCYILENHDKSLTFKDIYIARENITLKRYKRLKTDKPEFDKEYVTNCFKPLRKYFKPLPFGKSGNKVILK